MSKYIPGNQKHFFVKILRPSQRKLDHGVFLTGTTKELSIMPKTFVYTAITVKKRLWKNHSLRCQMHILSNLQPDL